MSQSSVDTLSKKQSGITLKTVILIFVAISFLLAAGLAATDAAVGKGYQNMEQATLNFVEAQRSASQLAAGSDYLTEKVRSFVATGELNYLLQFYEEVDVTQRREKAVTSLKAMLPDEESPAYEALAEALNLSNALIAYENHAMCLVLDIGDYDEARIPAVLRDLELPQQERTMSDAEKERAAVDLVFGNTYSDYKDRIRGQIDICTQSLITESEDALVAASERVNALLRLQTGLIVVQIAVILALALFLSVAVRKPLCHMLEQMLARKTADAAGTRELRDVAAIYNAIVDGEK